MLMLGVVNIRIDKMQKPTKTDKNVGTFNGVASKYLFLMKAYCIC